MSVILASPVVIHLLSNVTMLRQMSPALRPKEPFSLQCHHPLLCLGDPGSTEKVKNFTLSQSLAKDLSLALPGNWSVRQKILRVVEKPSPEHFTEGKMNVAESLSLSSGCKFDLIKKASVKDLMEACLQLGKKSKKGAVIDIFTA